MFGVDDKLKQYERLNRTLKQQLADRDAKISKCQAELNTKTQEWEEARRAADHESARALAAETRASKVEVDLATTRADLGKLQLNVSNYEALLRAEERKSAEVERERKRWDYEMMNGSSPSIMPQPDATLADKVKTLEADLARQTAEITQLRAAEQSMVAPTTDFFGSRLSRPPSREVSNMNVDGHVAQRDAVHEAALGEVDSLKKQLNSVKTQLDEANRGRDRAVNERMAFEKKSSKTIEELQEQVEDLRYEINGKNGSGNGSRIDQVRDELNNAKAKVDALDAAVKEKEKEIQRLTPLASASTEHEAKIATLIATLASLESESLRNPAKGVSAPSEDSKALEALQGTHTAVLDALETTNVEKETSLKLLAESRTTVASLEARIEVLTGEIQSTSQKLVEMESSLASARQQAKKAEDERDMASAQYNKLSAELETISAEAACFRTEKDQQIADLHVQLSAAATNLSEKEGELASSKDELETLTSELMDLEKDAAELDAVRTTLEQKEMELSTAKEDLAHAVADRQNAQVALKQLKDEMQAHPIPDVDAIAAEYAGQLEVLRAELCSAIESRDSAANEVVKHVAAIAILEEQVCALQVLNGDASAEQSRFPSMENTIHRLRRERDGIREQLRFARTESDFMLQAAQEVTEQVQHAKQTIEEELRKKTELYNTLRFEHESLQERVAELEVEVQSDPSADRVIELETERNAALEQVRKLGAQMATLKEELDTANAELKALSSELETEKFRRVEAEQHIERIQAVGSDESHRTQIDELSSRIGRRNTEIKNLKTDQQQLQYKLQDALDGVQDLDENNEELRKEIRSLQDSLTDTQTRLQEAEVVKADLETRLVKLVESQASLDCLSATHSVLQAEHESLVQQHSTLSAHHATVVSRAEVVALDLDRAKAEIVQHNARVSELETALVHAESRLAAASINNDLVLAIAVHHQAYVSATKQARQSQAAQSNALAQAAAYKKQVAALREEQAVLLQRRSNVNDTLRQSLESTRNELASSQALADTSEQRIAQLTESEAGLMAKMADAETQHASLQNKITNLETALSNSKATLEKAQRDTVAAAEEHAAAIGALRTAATDSEKDYAEMLAKSQVAQAEVRLLEAKVARLEEQLAGVSGKLESAREEIGNLTIEVEGTKGKLASRLMELATAHGELDTLRATVRTSETDLSVARTKIDTTGSELQVARTEIDDVRAKLSVAESDLAAARAELTSLRGTLEATQTDTELARSDVATVTSKLETAEEDLTALRKELETSNLDTASMRSKLQTTEDELSALRSDMEALRSEDKTALNKIEDELAGVYEELDTVKGQVEVVTSERDTAMANLTAARTDFETTRTDLETTKNDLDTACRDLEAVRTELAGMRSNHEEATTERTVVDEALKLTREELEATRSNLKTSQDSLSEALTKLDSTETELQASKVKLKELSAMQGDSVIRAANAEAGIEALSAEVARFETEVATAATNREAQVARITELLSDLSAVKADYEAAVTKLDEQTTSIAMLSTARESLEKDLQDARDALIQEQKTAETSDAKATEAEKEVRALSAKIEGLEKQNEELSARVSTLSDKLATGNDAPVESDGVSVDILTKRNEELLKEVAEAREDLELATQQLTSKTNEIDEADDRAMEFNKEINKLRKKGEKLERQNKLLAAKFEAMQATSKVPVAPAVASSAAVSTSSAAATPATTRASARSPGSGIKRRRDEEDEQVPREARIQTSSGVLQPRPCGENQRTPSTAKATPGKPIATKVDKTDRALKRRLSPTPKTERKTLGTKHVAQSENAH